MRRVSQRESGGLAGAGAGSAGGAGAGAGAESGAEGGRGTADGVVYKYATRLRVRYCECDPMGVAHHAAYVPWLEMGRTDLLRAGGRTYKQLEAEGTYLVIVKLEVRYRRPVLYDDVVEVRTAWEGGGRVKIEHAYEVVVVERDGRVMEEVAATAQTVLGCVDAEGKVRELPGWLVRG